MNDILDDLRNKLHLDYISDLRFYEDKNKLISIFHEFYDTGKYSEEQIKQAAAYIIVPKRNKSNAKNK